MSIASKPLSPLTYFLLNLNHALCACVSPLAMFANELMRQEQARLSEARKISVVNVNPTNIRPHSDTPEIRKYKKRFNSEILCAALWGEHSLNAHFQARGMQAVDNNNSMLVCWCLLMYFCVFLCVCMYVCMYR